MSVLTKTLHSTVRGLKWGRVTLQNKINVFVFMFVHTKHSSYLLRKLNSSLKHTMLSECSFIGTTVKQLSKPTADWWNYWGELLQRGSSKAGGKTLVKVFLLSVVMVFNWVHFGHSWNENVYLCTYAKCFCCWGQYQCAVCYSFSLQSCNGKNVEKHVTVSPEDARSKPSVTVLCSTWTLFECFFYFWGTSSKKVNDTVCHCCTVSVEIWILCLVL